MKCSAPFAAYKHLEPIRYDADNLDEEKEDIFHSVFANMLCSSHNARPDMLKAIRNIYTRVTAPDVDDWGNLKILLQFINRNITDERFIGKDSLQNMVTWIDAPHAIHTYM